MRVIESDHQFVRVAREEIVNVCSESPEMTELFGSFVMKYLRAYRRFREFAPEVFKLTDSQFTHSFSSLIVLST